MPTRISFFLAVLVAAGLSSTARADIPPDPDSADAHCTEAEQCPGGTFCDYAFSPGAPESEWKGVGESCRVEAQSKGLERRCRNGGNYGGQELFCKPGATGSWSPGQKTSPPEPAPAPKPPTPEPPKPDAGKGGANCAVDADGSWAGLLVFAALAWRRRRG